MAIRVYKPTSSARRFMSVLTFEEITKKTPEKSLTEIIKKNAGRNKQGKITVRLSTIRTAAPSSPCSTMWTAKSATSWLLWI